MFNFSLIPLPYKILGGLAAFLMAVVIAFSFGYHSGSTKSDLVIQTYANQAMTAYTKIQDNQNKINDRVITQYVDRIQKVKEKEYVYVNAANNIVPKQNQMSEGWIYTHDRSALLEEADREKAKDPNPSGIYDTEALATIVTNYSKCNQTATQLESLQTWIKESTKSINSKK